MRSFSILVEDQSCLRGRGAASKRRASKVRRTRRTWPSLNPDPTEEFCGWQLQPCGIAGKDAILSVFLNIIRFLCIFSGLYSKSPTRPSALTQYKHAIKLFSITEGILHEVKVLGGWNQNLVVAASSAPSHHRGQVVSSRVCYGAVRGCRPSQQQ